ncbi:hypothetical protein CAEBREN_23015 [Caenorhabditis brenneri]|uniref:T20D4.11-like domain-containing protein n=1 Tax=Caenorhabditis brenneri TaxID=135651 RepID=G0NMD5_CAEBE|nr:hypothetical protein CAEBREN_23015 [Caenorhabditis brenneri]
MSYLTNAFKLLLLLHLSTSVQSINVLEECGYWTTAKLGFQCGSILSDVAEKDWKTRSIKEVVEACDKAIDCLSSYDCEAIRDARNKIIQTCDQTSYLDSDNMLCLQSFYQKAYMTKFENRTYGSSDSCFHEHSFMDANLDKRQQAYKNGKLCFIKYVRDYCTPEALEYFNAVHYDRFVENNSIDSSSLPCNNPINILNVLQCETIIEEYSNAIQQWVESDDDERTNLGRLKEMCSDSKDCVTSLCIDLDVSSKNIVFSSCSMLEELK